MSDVSIVGGCQCEALRFELKAEPLFTHACHCLNCRRRSGTAFGLNTIVLKDDFAVTRGELVTRQISPRTKVYLCAACNTAVYSSSTRFPTTYNLRGGTVDDPSFVEPGAHIWVKRKHPWIQLPGTVPQFDEDYDIQSTWPREALDRLEATHST